MTILEKYVTCMYFAITTMTTVGYGDVTPRTQLEQFFVIFIMLVACVVFGYTIGKFGGLMAKLTAKKTEYREKIQKLNRYMRHYAIPFELQDRVRKYIEYAWNKYQDSYDEQEILETLSEPLRMQVVSSIHTSVLKS